MQTPLQLEIQGFQPSGHLKQLIQDNIDKLERRFGRMTACRVAIRSPDAHHRMGEPYFVTIRLALPGRRDVTVKPPPRARDRRQGEVNFAVNDAFRRAARQLSDHATKMKSVAPPNASQPQGKVISVDAGGNFGFLESEDGREIYFHANSVLGGKFSSLKTGDRVSYHEESGEKGAQASTVRLR